MSTTSNAKITKEHLARRAVVYLRQSSERQVQHNRESRDLQYAMAERGTMLGFSRVEIMDQDLGSSASVGARDRQGFERLLAAVALGDVGIVLSREVSRLSRTDKDWCRLPEVCQIFETLIGDDDHVYDLSSLDDQLLLGIKGTLSVVELKVLRKRLGEGMRNKARRGDLYRAIAPGYVLDALDRLVIDPDQGVRDAIALVFRKFRETGSARQTVNWFHEHGVELPVNKSRNGKLKIIFQVPATSHVFEILRNPIYAGAYVYGRRPTETVFVDGALKRRQRSVLPPEQSEVFLREHHEGYIDWATYEENRRIMRNNNFGEPDSSVGPARQGQGLLCGLLRCRRCARKLHVRYWGKSPDLVVFKDACDASVGASHWDIYPWTPSGFAATPVPFAIPAPRCQTKFDVAVGGSGSVSFAAMDLRGAGHPELVVFRDACDATVGSAHWDIYPWAASGFAPSPASFALPAPRCQAPFDGAASAYGAVDYAMMAVPQACTSSLVVFRDTCDLTVGESHWDVYDQR